MDMIDTIPRPEVSAERYRELDILAMQFMVQLPHDVGECLIVRDLLGNHLRRWIMDKRLPRHQEPDISEPGVIRLKVND